MMPKSASRRAAIRRHSRVAGCCLGLGLAWSVVVGAAPVPQGAQPSGRRAAQPAVPVQAPASVEVAADYVLGPADVLSIVFWGERDLSTEVIVRPDGKISLPLLNDVVAAGLTPEQLRRRLAESAKRYLEAPVVTVVVKQVNNNRVFVTGQVLRPGPYVLSGPTTVLQVLAMAGGFTEFADRKHVLVTRIDNGAPSAFTFNYDDVIKRRDLSQLVPLKAGDTVVVP